MIHLLNAVARKMPAPLLEKQKAKAIKQAKKLLQREGLLPPDEPLAS